MHPLLVVTTSFTGNVPDDMYTCTGFCKTEFPPSPNDHKLLIVPVDTTEVLLKVKLLPLRHCAEIEGAKPTIGCGFTVINLLTLSTQPLLLVTFNFTV